MLKFIGSPLVRISVGLVMLTCCILLMFEFLGLVPNQKKPELQFRKVLVESLAIQLNSDIIANRQDIVRDTLMALVNRNDNVLSAAVRKTPDNVIVQFGNHKEAWLLKPSDSSTPTQVQVPLYFQGEHWGGIEVVFSELEVVKPFYILVIFVAISGFICYLLFLKRTMLELDPSAVVPERVGNALNTFSEGLLIVDEKEQIIFANESFQMKYALLNDSLIGKKASDLDWQLQAEQNKEKALPWLAVINGEAASSGTDLKLRSKSGKFVSFKVNAAPISGSRATIRGALVTFNDITELEIKNTELGRLLEKLKHGQEEIAAQNKELKYLATRDPLTACLNRRSFFEGLNALIIDVKTQRYPLSCIMMDIDHFKSVNDRFGHAVGDKVIKMVAAALKEISRPNDLVGRYGGEEFCVVLPHTTPENAAKVAERMRVLIMDNVISIPDDEFSITSSFGISGWENSIINAEEFVSQADEALYVAKESGRNRVEIWAGIGEGVAQSSASQVEQTETNVQEEQNVSSISGGASSDGNISASVIEPASDVPPNINLEPFSNIDEFKMKPETFELPSRPLMLDRITQAIVRAERFKGKCALLVLDLEKAHRINNTMGRATCEKLIRQTAKKLSDTFRSTDSVSIIDIAEFSFSLSQISSYEFAILLADFDEDVVVINALNRIFKVLDKPAIVEGTELYLDSHIGISIYPEDGQDPEELIGNGSAAMHEARLMRGRNNFRYFSAGINKQANQQIKTENDLHKAVERSEFLIYYQPKVELNTGELCGMEALVRWLHPELGIISPDVFIPIAESNGIIESISSYVISTVCKQQKAWQDAGLPIVPIAVNLSPVDFRNKMLANDIISTVARSELLPEHIELEITENIAVDNLGATVELIQELNDAGISVSLDDFGTGFCSYSYLKHFAVDKIKIDRSLITGFTDNTYDAAIVNSIITLGQYLGLKIVAEGIETVEQLRFLRDLHCHQIQGYFISKPVPHEEAIKFLLDPAVIRRKIQASLGVELNAASRVDPTATAELTGILNKANYSNDFTHE